MRSIHKDFEGFANSAMKQTEENQIRRGRGFGGTGYIYPKALSNNIKPLIKYNHERVSVMELTCNDFDIVLINVYMPFLDRSDIPGATSQFDEIIGFIEFIISERSDAQFVLLGDFNCNLYNDSHPFASSLNNFTSSHNLICTFSMMESFQIGSTYTRYDSRSKSLLDYIFVSQGLREFITKVSIGEYHDNHSDHLPVEIELSLLISHVNGGGAKPSQNHNHVIWSKLSSTSLDNFSSTMETALDLIDIPPSILHGHCLCSDDTHKYDLELYFSMIVDCITLADSVLDRSCFRALKPFWSPELSLLKQQSYLHHKAWLDSDKPLQGPIYDSHLLSRANYRCKLRQEKRKNAQSANDKLYANLIEKDSASFWRTWKSISQSKDPLPPQIDGYNGDEHIANRFSNVFSDIYQKNDTSSHDGLRREFELIFPAYHASHIHDDISRFYFTWQDMLDVVSKLRTGKSYAGFIKAEHVLHGSPKLVIHLHILFNAMLQHSYVPTLLLRGNISPLVKNRDGNVSDSGNYRAITLSSIFIQMYESLERSKFGYFFPQSDFQFGFKPGVSTSHAIFCLKETVDHFTRKGSRVFLSFLDCSKAFDRISHWGLFIKLIKQNVPLCFLMSVIFLYLNMSCTTKWNASMSNAFDIPTGTKQGGILSPDFFGLYMHGLIERLKLSGFGCDIISMIIACIFFADDIVLLSPSRHGLQQMLNICVEYCKEFCLDFNVTKSKVMVIGKLPADSQYASLLLRNEPLDFVDEYKYLGVDICAGKTLSFSPIATIRSFHRAANSILYSKVKPNNDILMKLLYTNCVPIITYASAVRVFSSTEMYRCHVAVNNAIRKIFSFAVWQSIRNLRISHGYKSIYELFSSAKAKFLANAPNSSNNIVSHLSRLV